MNYKRLLELILVNLDEGIIVTDEHANITFYKAPVSNIGGIDAQLAVGKNILAIFPDLTEQSSTFYQVIKTKKPLIEHIQHYTNYQGKKVSTVTSTIPIFENGELCGCFEIFKDLTQVMELSEKIMQLQEQLYHTNKKDKSRHPETAAFSSGIHSKEILPNGTQYTFLHIVGTSSLMSTLKEKAKRAASSDAPVLIYGETGTGKELLVQAMHNASNKRRKKPFIAQNCAALPYNLLEAILFGTASGSFTGAKDNPGLFELADGGTLFLDEINSLDISLQAKLLRVIQDGVVRRVGDTKTRNVDVRIMASTNEEPRALLEKKRLREDLYYRLNAVYLEIPPLRARKEDIKTLTAYFIDKNNAYMNKAVVGVTEEVQKVFEDYFWPGNVRELENLIESAMNFSDKNVLDIGALSYDFEKRLSFATLQQQNIPLKCDDTIAAEESIDLNKALYGYERQLIMRAVNSANGNYSRAARTLNIPKQTLHNKIKKFGISLKADLK